MGLYLEAYLLALNSCDKILGQLANSPFPSPEATKATNEEVGCAP